MVHARRVGDGGIGEAGVVRGFREAGEEEGHRAEAGPGPADDAHHAIRNAGRRGIGWRDSDGGPGILGKGTDGGPPAPDDRPAQGGRDQHPQVEGLSIAGQEAVRDGLLRLEFGEDEVQGGEGGVQGAGDQEDAVGGAGEELAGAVGREKRR
jgi:hypothetical protein